MRKHFLESALYVEIAPMAWLEGLKVSMLLPSATSDVRSLELWDCRVYRCRPKAAEVSALQIEMLYCSTR